MTTITRERIEQALANPTKITFNYGETLELARIALASLEAEAVAWTDEQELRDVEASGCGYLFTVYPVTPYADPSRVIKLYAAPPAPVVPDECPAEIREMMASHSDALFNDDDAQKVWNACRAAMLQGRNNG